MGQYLKSVFNNIEASKSVILESVMFGQVMLQTGKKLFFAQYRMAAKPIEDNCFKQHCYSSRRTTMPNYFEIHADM